MARPSSSRRASSAAASMEVKPSTVRTVVGMSYSIRRVSGSSRDASRLSTGLMTYFLTASTCSAVSSPSRTYTRAVRTVGRSPWDKIWMHWAAESARWSYWPGRYSTANTVSP